MRAITRYWFPSAVALLLSVIGFNLYTIARVYRSGAGEFESALPSRTITIAIASQMPDTRPGAEEVANALETVAGVEHVRVDGKRAKAVTLTLRAPVRLSALKERLKAHEVRVVESESRLEGSLRLYVSGTT